MPLALLQARGADSVGSVTSLALAFLLDVSPGSLLVIAGERVLQAGVMTVADSVGHTFTGHERNPVLSQYAAADADLWWVLEANPGTDTVTITIGGSAQASLCILEYQGHAIMQPVAEAANMDDSGIAPVTTGAMSLPAACGLVGLVCGNNPTTMTPSGAGVQRYADGVNGNFAVADQLDAAGGMASLDWTSLNPVGFGALGAAFETVQAIAQAAPLGIFNSPLLSGRTD